MLGPISPHFPLPPSPLVVRLPYVYLWNPAAPAAVTDLVWQLWVCIFQICSCRESLIGQGLSSCTLKAAVVVLKSCFPWYAPSQWLVWQGCQNTDSSDGDLAPGLPEGRATLQSRMLAPNLPFISLLFKGSDPWLTLPSPSGPFHMFSHRSLH